MGILLTACTGTEQEALYINEIPFGHTIDSFGDDLSLITGEESFYQEYQDLKKSLLKNRSIGLEEGYYNGQSLQTIDGKEASKINFYFFKDRLYKIRWTFHRLEYPDLETLSKDLDQSLTVTYGPPNGKAYFGNMVWVMDSLYLQTFLDFSDYQIELRLDSVHHIVSTLTL
jgi:hypothetical protein